MSEILPQSPEICPCLDCKDRHFNEETKHTCHCDCKKYEKWADNNRKRHEERYRSLLKDEDSKAKLKESTVKIWECLKCGHIVTGTTPPEYCSVCDEYNPYFEVKEDTYDLILSWGR
jgi:rubrerythrin